MTEQEDSTNEVTPTTIKAQDAEIDRLYLSAYMRYKVVVKKKHFTVVNDQEICTRVTVEAESFPGRNIDISGGTELIVYDSSLHVPVSASADQISKKTNKTQSQKKDKVMDMNENIGREEEVSNQIPEASEQTTMQPVDSSTGPIENAGNVKQLNVTESDGSQLSRSSVSIKPSRAKVIDVALLEAGTAPPDTFFEELASSVIDKCGETEEKRKAIITQAKVRWSWYYKHGKPNPQARL